MLGTNAAQAGAREAELSRTHDLDRQTWTEVQIGV